MHKLQRKRTVKYSNAKIKIKEKRKTITGEDLLDAFRTLGFDEYTSPLESFLRCVI